MREIVDVSTVTKSPIEKKMDDSESRLISFVETQISKMDHHLLFDGNTSPSLYMLDQALMQHEHVLLALTSLYETSRWELKSAQQIYNEWYAEKFMEVRNRENNKISSVSKWYKKEEIDYMVQNENRDQMAALKASLEEADSKRSLLQRLIDGWNSYHWTLMQLSKNGIAEKNVSDVTKTESDDDNL